MEGGSEEGWGVGGGAGRLGEGGGGDYTSASGFSKHVLCLSFSVQSTDSPWITE